MVPPNDKKAPHQSIRAQYVIKSFLNFLQSVCVSSNASRSITINVLSIDYVTSTRQGSFLSSHLGMYSIAKLNSGWSTLGQYYNAQDRPTQSKALSGPFTTSSSLLEPTHSFIIFKTLELRPFSNSFNNTYLP